MLSKHFLERFHFDNLEKKRWLTFQRAFNSRHGVWWYAAAAKSLQLCPTLCDPIDGSPPGSPVPGILQARTLEWVAISFSNEWKWKVKVKSLIRVWLLATPWTAAHQAPPSIGFSRQEYWSGVPLPSPWWDGYVFYSLLPTRGSPPLSGKLSSAELSLDFCIVFLYFFWLFKMIYFCEAIYRSECKIYGV